MIGAPETVGSPAHATRVRVRGLSTNVLSWEPPAGVSPSGLTVLLLHGFADAAATFDLVAPTLASAGHRLFAPDLRGFGDTDRVGAGGYYHFPDYVADVRELVRAVAPVRLAVVGHSMGATIAAMYAGTVPSAVERLALLEGLGPPEHDLAHTPDRFRAWLEGLDGVAKRPEHRSLSSIDACVERLAIMHPNVPSAVLATRAPLLARRGDDGRWVWKFDPLHRTTAPTPFVLSSFTAFLREIRCPTLLMTGGRLGFRTDDEDERFACLADGRRVDVEGAGHMMHWTRPDEVAMALGEFLAGA